MRIVSHYVREINGIEVYPIIAVLIFFAFFLTLLYHLYRMDNGFVSTMSNLPIEDDSEIVENQKEIK